MKLLQPETKKTGRKGQNDNDHHIPETEPGAPMTTELFSQRRHTKQMKRK